MQTNETTVETTIFATVKNANLPTVFLPVTSTDFNTLRGTDFTTYNSADFSTFEPALLSTNNKTFYTSVRDAFEEPTKYSYSPTEHESNINANKSTGDKPKCFSYCFTVQFPLTTTNV